MGQYAPGIYSFGASDTGHPMAEGLFLVSSMLGKLFHLGDGPAILRRAAAEVGVSALRNGRMPGGHAKQWP